MPHKSFLLLATWLGATGWTFATNAAPPVKPEVPPDPAQIEFFENKIRPILTEHCLKCHSEKDPEAALRLDLKAGWSKGGESGPAIRPGKPKESLLIKMVSGRPAKMPPESILPEPLIADLIKWVEMGAPDPRDGTLIAKVKTIDWDAGRKFWAFQPIADIQPPPANGPHQRPIDRFVAAKWQTAGVKPVAKADKATLIRRVTYSLTGLPPTLDEVKAFESDSSSDALAKVVDRLLASKRYGEHQARQWLDVVRYGEDKYSQDDKKESSPWRYRDWVIQAFNDDLPYDRFVKLQIAADALEEPNADSTQDRAALGFLALGPTAGFVNDNDKSSAEEWSDKIDVLTRGFIGLTVGCARCHDHKYDPIPTEDYYSLAGVMASTKTTIVPVAKKAEIEAFTAAKKVHTEAEEAAKAFLQAEFDRRAIEKADVLVEYALKVWEYRLKKLEKPDFKAEDFVAGTKLTASAITGLDKYLKSEHFGKGHYLQPWAELLPKADGPKEPTEEVRKLAETFRDKVKENLAKPLKMRNLDQPKDLFGEKGILPLTDAALVAEAAVPWKEEYTKLQAVVKGASDKLPPEPAQCIAVEDKNPQDIQIQLRGNPHKKGAKVPRRFLKIIAGDEPVPFKDGSGRKELAEAIVDPANPLTVRVIVNRIWQQHFGLGIVATPSNFGALGIPPTHPELLDYLATQFVKQGWSIKKLHREILRSETFQRASTIDTQNMKTDPENRWLWRVSPRRLTIEAFRDSVLTAAGTLDLKEGGPSDNLDEMKTTRRTVYGKVSRRDLSKLLQLWDFADPNITSERRNESTLPQQMLFLMNSPFIVDNAKKLAARVEQESKPEDKIKKAFEFALSRAPTAQEVALVSKFLAAEDAPLEKGEKLELSRVERFVQSLLAGNEFFFVN